MNKIKFFQTSYHFSQLYGCSLSFLAWASGSERWHKTCCWNTWNVLSSYAETQVHTRGIHHWFPSSLGKSSSTTRIFRINLLFIRSYKRFILFACWQEGPREFAEICLGTLWICSGKFGNLKFPKLFISFFLFVSLLFFWPNWIERFHWIAFKFCAHCKQLVSKYGSCLYLGYMHIYFLWKYIDLLLILSYFSRI